VEQEGALGKSTTQDEPSSSSYTIGVMKRPVERASSPGFNRSVDAAVEMLRSMLTDELGLEITFVLRHIVRDWHVVVQEKLEYAEGLVASE